MQTRTEPIGPLETTLFSEGQTANAGEQRNIKVLLHRHCPGILPLIKEIIETSEIRYCAGSRKESFLWQHTVHVASMAMLIACKEDLDPLIPVITALFHDCGKFQNGKYHEGVKPEEEIGAETARKLLSQVDFPEPEIQKVEQSLLALYNDHLEGNIHTRIVSDADYLVKVGYMGFANFFERSALRGMVVRNSILKTLTKELTYAASLESHMFTRAGRELAQKKSEITISLFRNYLEELRHTGISDYEIRKETLPWERPGRDAIPVFLVLPRFCKHCSNPMAVSFEQRTGIKREQLVVKITCSVCDQNTGYDFSFCLP